MVVGVAQGGVGKAEDVAAVGPALTKGLDPLQDLVDLVAGVEVVAAEVARVGAAEIVNDLAVDHPHIFCTAYLRKLVKVRALGRAPVHADDLRQRRAQLFDQNARGAEWRMHVVIEDQDRFSYRIVVAKCLREGQVHLPLVRVVVGVEGGTIRRGRSRARGRRRQVPLV